MHKMAERVPLYRSMQESVEDLAYDELDLRHDDKISSRTRSLFTVVHRLFGACHLPSLGSLPSILHFLLVPTFLQTVAEKQSSRSSATSALDGLRGVACFIVVIFHFGGLFYDLNHGFIYEPGEPGGGKFATIWNLPFLKIWHSGTNMVAIFFVISGYVLSHRTLTLLASGKVEAALSSMASSIFRRFMRLFAPVTVVTLMWSVLNQLGFFEWSKSKRPDEWYPVYPTLEPTVWLQTLKWWQVWSEILNVFTWERMVPGEIDGDLWTIPVEYRCSMCLFLAAVGLAKVKLRLRIAFLVLLSAWAIHARVWEISLFLIGMLIAQIDIVNARRAERRSHDLEKMQEDKPSRRRWVWVPILLFGWYCNSMPWTTENAWGWVWIESVNPFPSGYIFSTWQTIGASIAVAATTNLHTFQLVFNTAPVQYLGRLSYALYLIHGPMTRMVGYGVGMTIREWLNAAYPDLWETNYHASSVLAFPIFIVPTVLLADFFMRAVDVPSTNVSHRIWKYCTA